jgi:hypothetical protein
VDGAAGIEGRPESASTPLGLMALLTPSLFLGVACTVLMVSVHHYASKDRRIWRHVGLAFATIYAVVISINFYVQLTLVVPRLVRGDIEPIRFLLFVPFASFLYSVDTFGYSFMSLSTLLAAFVFTGTGLERTVRRFLITNGLILPSTALQNYYHPLIWPAVLWAVTFPGSTISLAILFRKSAED